MKRILLTIDPSEYSKTAFKYAADIANYYQAKVEGIAIVDKLSVTEAVFTFVPLPQGYDEHIKKENELFKDVRKKTSYEIAAFKRQCKKQKINCSGKVFEGRPDFILEEESLYYDLIITGLRNRFHFETKKEPEKPVTDFIKNAQTPILTVPKNYREVNNVLFAFDGSQQSLQAIKSFLMLMRDKNYNLMVLIHNSNQQKAKSALNKLDAYLQNHQNLLVEKVHTKNSLVHTFDKEFLSKTDLVVCGKNSQSFMQHLYVGSFTKHLINLNKIPVFIG